MGGIHQQQSPDVFGIVSDCLRPIAAARPRRPICSRYCAARERARIIILSRSRRNAALLSLSRSAGIAANADSIAMSFASAKLVFINCNSFSILSNVRFDKSFSRSNSGDEHGRWPLERQQRSHHCTIDTKIGPAANVCFGSVAVAEHSTWTADSGHISAIPAPASACYSVSSHCAMADAISAGESSCMK